MTITEVRDDNFQTAVVDASELVLLDFWATWCQPCKTLSMDLEAIAADFAGKVKIVKINADEQPALAAQFGVRSLPTMVVTKNGQPVDMRNGAMPRSKLVQWLSGAAAA